MNKKLLVKCPQCKTEFSYYESQFRPFCCEKCQQIDLGHWFKESYVVPAKEQASPGMQQGLEQEVQDESLDSENNIDRDDDENNESEYH